MPASTWPSRVASVPALDISINTPRDTRKGRLTLGPRGRVYPREHALGEGDVLVQVIEDLVQLLADAGVLLNPGLELVKQRGVDHGRRHLELLLFVWLVGCGVVFVLPDVCRVELCTAHRRLLSSVLRRENVVEVPTQCRLRWIKIEVELGLPK
jgi:hypothetical protein